MPQYALIRTNGGEVLKVGREQPAAKVQTFEDADLAFHTVLEITNAGTQLPNGRDVFDPAADRPVRRVFMFAKQWDGGTIIANATQPEIDTWAAAEAADEKQIDENLAKDEMQVHPRKRKQARAVAKMFNNIEARADTKLNEIIAAVNAQHGTAVDALVTRTPAQFHTAYVNQVDKDD